MLGVWLIDVYSTAGDNDEEAVEDSAREDGDKADATKQFTKYTKQK